MSKHRRSTLHHYFKKADSKTTSGNRGQRNPLFHPAFSVEYYKRNDSCSSKKSLGHGQSMSVKAVNKESIKFWCPLSKKADLTSQLPEELLSKHQQCALHHDFKRPSSKACENRGKLGPLFQPPFFGNLISNDIDSLRDLLGSGRSSQNPIRAPIASKNQPPSNRKKNSQAVRPAT
jgi:hypothetical protein